MKKLVAAAALSALISGSAVAADLSYPIKAPLAPITPVMSWTGFYVGASLGATFGSSGFNYNSPFYSHNYGEYGSQSFSAGGYLGYNWQVQNIVFGVEGEANWLNASFKDTNAANGAFLNSDWQFALSARVGYLLTPGSLLYVKGGWAFTDASIGSVFYTPGYTYNDGYRNGALVGVGLETLMGRNWLVRVEAEYTINGESASIGIPYGPATVDFDPDFLTAKLGVGYKF